MNYSSNIRLLLTDEISLEGLDGITLQTLWIRIAHTTNTNLPFSERLEKEYWNVMRRIDDFNFYELPEPRPDYIPHIRKMCVDNNQDLAYFEPEDVGEDIYIHKVVNDPLKGVKGSCPTYFSRNDMTDIAKNMDYEDAKLLGNKLIIVASQELREYSLIGAQVSHCTELSPIQYCVLERIGRSRYEGEITQGKRSLQVIGEDSKSLFYHRKTLLKYKLITKQIYYQKSGTQTFSGSLIHLQRFYVEKKSKQLMLTEQIVDILKTRPNYRVQYSEIMNELNLSKPLRKLLKSSQFQRFVNTDVKVPYREYFPRDNSDEWKHKKSDKEKIIRCIQLIDPEVDVAENWFRCDSDDDDDDDGSGYKDYGNLKFGLPLLPQAAEVVRSRGEAGCCQSELGKIMGVNKLTARSFCRSLVRRNVVDCVMKDMGRQRVTRFTSRKYETKGFLTVQIKQERDKMLNLMSSTNNDIIVNNDEDIDDNSRQSSIVTVSSSNEKFTNDTSISLDELTNSEEPPAKKIQLSPEISLKRSLEDLEEPIAKKMRSESEQNLENIEVKLTVIKSIPGLKGCSQGFVEQFKNESNKFEASRVTYRILRRANYIIEIIREVKVMTDLIKLKKRIQEIEKSEGYNMKLDKKSLLRLVLKLAKEGHLKYMKATLSSSGKTKSISFVCEPNIDENHSIIQSAIEQIKMKFHVSGCPKKITKTVITQPKVAPSRKMAKMYGFSPKFIRMRRVHELLYYLVYEQQIEPLTTPEEYKNWLDNLNFSYDDELISEMTPVYHKTNLNWKSFIPPAPKHAEWPNGWILISDVLLRMPVSIFTSCFSMMYEINGLENYLNHPIRKYFLVKHLPVELRNALMYKRRFIFQMHEMCTKLCYCGLLQFGQQKLKEKDQVFIYLNRNASILNTTTSEEGYHEISSKEYDKHMYTFNNSFDVETYWYDLWSTCMNTLLGGRNCLTGKYIVLEDLHTKKAMIEALIARTPEEAVEQDTGNVPGNRRGAAGLDSALFAHLRRSWNWNANTDAFCISNKPVGLDLGTETVHNPNEYLAKAKTHIITGGKRNLNKIPKKPDENKPKKFKMTKKNIVRKIHPKKNSKPRKPFYDEIDKIALQKMGKLRTDWSPLEDHILLLCTIASNYLCPNKRKQMISFTVIRDVLHKLTDSSASKTSRACQRRILYIMKNMSTRYSVQMCLEEIYQSENITKKYKQICKRLINSHVPENEINIAFIELVSYMSVMFSKLIEPNKKIQIPNTVQIFKEKFRICGSFKKNVLHYKEPENNTDIISQVIRTVIHSSMCCTKDKTSWAYQLFKIYQQYPETLLRQVIAKTRQEQIISVKKSYMRTTKVKTNMPLSSSPYQLSIIYKYKLQTKFPYSIFEEAYKILTGAFDWLQQNNDSFEITNPLSGTAIALMELTDKLNLVYNFEIPDDIIVLDQSIPNDKYYDRIIKKYHNFINDPKNAEIEEKVQSDDEGNFPNIIDKKTDNSITIKNATSRIAFYMMRAEMCEGIDEKSTQHMHDFFVVNSCRVFINFPNFDKEMSEPEQIDEDFNVIKTKIVPDILQEIRNNAIISDECPTEEEIQNILENLHANDGDKNLAQKIIDLTLESGIFGATNNQILALLPQSYTGNLSPQNLLEILVNSKIILKTGVEKVRYVHYNHKRFWIVNSYKILRLDREKLPPATPATKDKLSTKLYRKKTNFPTKEIEISRERLDLRTEQKVKVLMSPWIRIDGTLNRRVLDKWLGTILTTCLQQPGISLQKLMEYFSFLRPVELDNLVKYLVKLNCIRQIIIKKSKTTLFSSIPHTTVEIATGLEDPIDIFIEPLYDATMKYAVFIGKKSYATDFLGN